MPCRAEVSPRRRVSHGEEILVRRLEEMIGACGAEVGGEARAAERCDLVGVHFELKAVFTRGEEQFLRFLQFKTPFSVKTSQKSARPRAIGKPSAMR